MPCRFSSRRRHSPRLGWLAPCLDCAPRLWVVSRAAERRPADGVAAYAATPSAARTAAIATPSWGWPGRNPAARRERSVIDGQLESSGHTAMRSEERRVGKERRTGWEPECE